MITKYPFEKLSQANHGWLQARHHFNFGSYFDPQRAQFGVLRVINDDIIQAGTGFAPHPHDNMEIITYVRSGAITHKDSQGNTGRTVAGDVQVMSAGTGIRHSEYNRETVDTSLYQIWIEPNRRQVEPRWDAAKFPKQPVDDALQLLVAGDDSAPLQIHQDAYIYAGRLDAGKKIHHAIHHQAYLLVSSGSVSVDGQRLSRGDGAEITEQASFEIEANEPAELLVIDVPTNP